MDSRIESHAEVLVDHCTDVGAGDQVAITAPPVAEDLVVALFERIAARDANPLWIARSRRAFRARIRATDPDALGLSEHAEAAVERADVVITVRGQRNTAQTSDVPPEKMLAAQRIQQSIQQHAMAGRWVGTQFPADGNAQHADMSTEAYREFVWDAINRDWTAQREFQEQMVELLDPAGEVRIVSGDRTDVSMSVAGMDAANDDGSSNMPGGEVYTAPVPESVEGQVAVDLPIHHQGRDVTDVVLEFEGGEVVDYEASRNEDLLGTILDADDGARRLGELGVGMNREIDRFTSNILFDEKMGDTVHLALGRALDECVPEDAEANVSATHVDVILDVSEDASVEVDGEVVQRDGTFVFEDGFEG